MKNSKYTYKNRIPKKWSKRKLSSKKEPFIRNKKQYQTVSKIRKKPLFKSLNPKGRPNIFTSRSTTWRLPTILFILSLLMIILIIPTLIVAPFAMKHNEVIKSEELIYIDEEKDDDKDIVDEKEPSLSVAVMRTNSDDVEDVPLEDYVTRVVASEMPAEFEIEALKAQGLATRTYVVNHLIHQESLDASKISDATDHQVYRNEEELRELYGSDYTWKMDKLTEAVKATEGEILTYNSKPITAAFFSTSNGYTENSEDYWDNEQPYLRSVESPWDKNSPRFLDQETFTIENIANALNIQLPSNQALRIEIDRTDSKRVKKLKINDYEFTGRNIREKLNLRSSDFEIQQKNNHLIFTTRGFGHGVGMSQYGANGLAKEGKGYEEIVKYYYQDVELSPIQETAPTLVVQK